ncbi:MAG: YccF domain-containing protein [Bacteroidales bacterium]|nr:YccF domain-containing protein [Bacteroidales bacterium]
MNSIGNLLWLIFGGIIIAAIYYMVGLLMCITIIGIPFGVQLFKLGTYSLWPFGHDLVNGPGEPGCLSIMMNLLWILLGWWEIAAIHLVCGLLFCVTIVGIPFGLLHFRLALASVFPFGKEIR